MTSDNKAAGLSSVGPTQLIQHSGPSEKIGREKRREERGPCQVLEAVSCVLLG